jgi:hypothetical protein
MDVFDFIEKLREALDDPEWHMLQLTDDNGDPAELTRVEALELLATLEPESARPPSAMN